MSPKPDSPSPLQSAPERSDLTPERSGTHQYCRYDAPNPTDTYDFPPSCVSHTFGALRPHSGALRSAPEHINIIAPTLQTPLIHVFFPSILCFPTHWKGI